MSEHTRTDQRVVFRVTTAWQTPDADWSWQTASGVLGSAKCGSAREFFCATCVSARGKRDIKYKGSERSGGRASKREVRRASKWSWQKKNTKTQRSGRQHFLTITCCHTNPVGKVVVAPNKNTRYVNSMGSTKRSPGSHSSAFRLSRRARRSFIPQMLHCHSCLMSQPRWIPLQWHKGN